MGIQSQNCNGSVQKMKKLGAKLKRKAKHVASRMNVASSKPFIPKKDCKRCRLAGTKELPSYHEGHNVLCPNKRENKMKIQQNTMRDYIEGGNVMTKRKAPPTPRTPVAPSVNVIAGSVGYNVQQLHSMGIDSDFVSDLKKNMDERMEKLEKDQEFDWAKNKQCPSVVILAVDLLLAQFSHKRKPSPEGHLPHSPKFTEAMESYYSFFPIGTTTFTFPEDTTGKPSPVYHCLSGQKIIYLDWQLAFPDLPLPCPECRGFMTHTRTNFLKNKGSLFPIWNQDGTIIWSVIMKYSCSKCNKTCDANDGRLLQLLPAHVAAAYPVPPRYATCGGGFHLHKDVIRYFEFMLKTYANGDQCSVFLVRAMATHYLDKAKTYLSQSPTKPFPDFYAYMNKKWPPCGSNIRRLYEQAEYSPLQPYGYSNYDRYIREIRSVTFKEGDTAAFDHTFAVTRAYRDKARIGMKCFADLINGRTGEIAGVYAVPSTKLSDVSHALTQAAPRLKNVSVMTTDTIPHGVDFWKTTLGKQIKCRLGLFHFIQRIIDTLDQHCEHYWRCMVQLKLCIYFYNKGDYDGLIKALRDGTLGEKKLTEEEIENLVYSKSFKQNYAEYLRKEFYTEEQIIEYLSDWLVKWNDVTDDSGRKVFDHRTVAVTREQMKKVKFVLDFAGVPSYEQVPSKGDHGLPKWKSIRGAEPKLEKFHELLAHYANIGCKEEFANALIARGTAEYNVGARFRYDCREKRRGGKKLDHPEYMDKSPIFIDHSLLDHLNQQSKELGFGDLFQDCRIPEVGNPLETFCSTYCREQNGRNEQEGIVASTKVCLCTVCKDQYESPQSVVAGFRRQSALAASNTGNAPELARAPPSIPPPPPPPIRAPPSPAAFVNHTTIAPQGNFRTNISYHNNQVHPINFFTANATLNPNLFQVQCFPQYPYRCGAFNIYCQRKESGEKVLGRPPHDCWCPKKMGFNYWENR